MGRNSALGIKEKVLGTTERHQKGTPDCGNVFKSKNRDYVMFLISGPEKNDCKGYKNNK